MHGWIARYEEGYVSIDGESISLGAKLRQHQAWATPEEALRHWLSLNMLSGARVELHGNGFIQSDDVSQREQFRAVGAARIWRKVTFVPSQDSVRMNPRNGGIHSEATETASPRDLSNGEDFESSSDRA